LLGIFNKERGGENMKSWKPIFIENSKIPVWLSYLAPINIGAIALFFLVFSRGKMNEVTRRHETIHFQQMLETFLIGFIVLYYWDYLVGCWKYRNDWKGQRSPRGHQYTSAANKAYFRIRAEREAYDRENTASYLSNRKRYNWIRKYKV
tara:strand:+ start:209 stop:655 length:447 start_codon:yes stop_codon:yes gene_type:complete